jgi:hypothetical protein
VRRRALTHLSHGATNVGGTASAGSRPQWRRGRRGRWRARRGRSGSGRRRGHCRDVAYLYCRLYLSRYACPARGRNRPNVARRLVAHDLFHPNIYRIHTLPSRPPDARPAPTFPATRASPSPRPPARVPCPRPQSRRDAHRRARTYRGGRHAARRRPGS